MPKLSLLDVRLATRLLVKNPALTLVGGLAMAVAIAVGVVFDVSAALLSAPLPIDEGDRVVAIENWDAESSNQETQILHDYLFWRQELRSVEDVGAYRQTGRTLIVPGGSAETVPIAEMTASGFRVARVAPLLGRPLVDDDERPTAQAVLVIGASVWRSRFRGDPAVIGRDIRMGEAIHTIVGVMPDGFAFPMNNQFWIPLRVDANRYGRREGPTLSVFGRLADGATLEHAQAELATIGERASVAFPETHRHLRPRVIGYTAQLADDMEGWEIPLTRSLLIMLLAVICVNVAVLVYARTAMRQDEIAVRSALGASRGQIVAQLFAEALVLASIAAAAGIAMAGFSFHQLNAWLTSFDMLTGGLPFWIRFELSVESLLYVVTLALIAAAIVGVVPALRATGRQLRIGLGRVGGTKMQLGKTWTTLIVAQVAFAVAVLPATVFFGSRFVRYGLAQPGFPAEEFLTASLTMEREVQPEAESATYNRDFNARYALRLNDLTARLADHPQLAGIAFASELPGQEPTVTVQVEGNPAEESTARHSVRATGVSVRFFDVFDVPALAGRRFEPADATGPVPPVVVNRSFVRDVLGDRNAVGRRIRYVEGYRAGGEMQTPAGVELGRWYEIVGVVGDLPPNATEPGRTAARIYRPLAPGATYPVSLAVRSRRGEPAAFAASLRDITAAIDPRLQLRDVRTLDDVVRTLQGGLRIAALALGLLTASVLLLSAAGIYAMMSFAVAQRRKEIGIRAALGADPRHLLTSLFSRAAAQLAAGVAVGLAGNAAVDRLSGGRFLGGEAGVFLSLVCVLMTVVGLLAAVGPARRGLRIDATEALKAEG